MQFYFLGSAQFMQDKGIESKYVPGAMALAQAAQAIATIALMMWLVENVGIKDETLRDSLLVHRLSAIGRLKLRACSRRPQETGISEK